MILFRVDANETIATGHLMRCMTIAKKLIDNGMEVLFCLAEKKFTDRMDNLNIPYIILNTYWKKMEEELPVLNKIINREKPEWIVVDSYQVTKKYLHDLNKMCRVFYYDDLCKDIYDIDTTMFPYRWGSEQYKEAYKNMKTNNLIGLKYLPIRDEFYPQEHLGKNILITTGGTDTYNISGKIIEKAYESDTLRQYHFDIVVGKMNANIKELEDMASDSKMSVGLHIDVNNMGELMRNSCCMVTAGGTTAYEVCACQIPAVCFAFADNQVEFVDNLGRDNIMMSVGDVRKGVDSAVDMIIKHLEQLIGDDELRDVLRKNMSGMIDGKGSSRICEYLSHINEE